MHPAMQLALQQADLADCAPNPRVGCVLLARDGRTIGMGHTQAVGGPHAEVMALRDAQARGESTAGATAFVTLEPCSHTGRTGPCCDALVAAGIARVVASLQDPNPLVGGRGFARLRAAGVVVEVGEGAPEAAQRNTGFLSRMRRGRPWVRLKVAASADGTTALADGRSQWITGEAARADGRQWRARAQALLTGIGTVLADDPLLDVRGTGRPCPPLAVADSRGRLSATARIHAADRPVWHYTAAAGRVDLQALLGDLGARGINTLHVEAGPTLNGALLQAGLVDELLIYLAPRLLGPGRPLAELPALADLDAAHAFAWHSVERVGDDLRLVAQRAVPGITAPEAALG